MAAKCPPRHNKDDDHDRSNKRPEKGKPKRRNWERWRLENVCLQEDVGTVQMS